MAWVQWPEQGVERTDSSLRVILLFAFLRSKHDQHFDGHTLRLSSMDESSLLEPVGFCGVDFFLVLGSNGLLEKCEQRDKTKIQSRDGYVVALWTQNWEEYIKGHPTFYNKKFDLFSFFSKFRVLVAYEWMLLAYLSSGVCEWNILIRWMLTTDCPESYHSTPQCSNCV